MFIYCDKLPNCDNFAFTQQYPIITVLVLLVGHLSDPLPRRVLGFADPPALLIAEVHARRELGLPHEGNVNLK